MSLKFLVTADRKAIFKELVELQDEGWPASASISHICVRHGITRKSLRKIEDEGIDKQWAPLGEDAD